MAASSFRENFQRAMTKHGLKDEFALNGAKDRFDLLMTKSLSSIDELKHQVKQHKDALKNLGKDEKKESENPFHPVRIYHFDSKGDEKSKANEIKRSMLSHTKEFSRYAGERVFCTKAAFHTNGKGEELKDNPVFNVISATFPRLADRRLHADEKDAETCLNFEKMCNQDEDKYPTCAMQVSKYIGRKQTLPEGALNQENYKKEIRKRLLLMFSAAKDEGNNVLMMPLIGLGAYIRNLHENDKQKAAQAVFDALNELVNDRREASLFTPNIVLSIPNGYDEESKVTQNGFFASATKTLDSCQSVCVVRKDDLVAMTNAIQAEYPEENAALVVPGGHHSHGGGWLDREVVALEKQLYRQSILGWLANEALFYFAWIWGVFTTTTLNANILEQDEQLQEKHLAKQGKKEAKAAGPAAISVAHEAKAPAAARPELKVSREVKQQSRPIKKEEEQRIDILTESHSKLYEKGYLESKKELAAANLEKWKQQAEKRAQESKPKRGVNVFENDWGTVALQETRTHGVTYAVLNMANATYPGGGYLRGLAAQEENMARRALLHKEILEEVIDGSILEVYRFNPEAKQMQFHREYTHERSDEINGLKNSVPLDIDNPLVCLRGQEKRDKDGNVIKINGYQWHRDDDVFPFYELRSAAKRYTDENDFDESDARRRITKQLDTLRKSNVRHVVLSAFGCGAFKNPPSEIAQIYREMLIDRHEDFDQVSFAIYFAGHGITNFSIFRNILEDIDFDKLKAIGEKFNTEIKLSPESKINADDVRKQIDEFHQATLQLYKQRKIKLVDLANLANSTQHFINNLNIAHHNAGNAFIVFKNEAKKSLQNIKNKDDLIDALQTGLIPGISGFNEEVKAKEIHGKHPYDCKEVTRQIKIFKNFSCELYKKEKITINQLQELAGITSQFVKELPQDTGGALAKFKDNASKILGDIPEAQHQLDDIEFIACVEHTCFDTEVKGGGNEAKHKMNLPNLFAQMRLFKEFIFDEYKARRITLTQLKEVSNAVHKFIKNLPANLDHAYSEFEREVAQILDNNADALGHLNQIGVHVFGLQEQLFPENFKNVFTKRLAIHIMDLFNSRKITFAELRKLAQHFQEYVQSPKPNVVDFLEKVSKSLGEKNKDSSERLLINIKLDFFSHKLDVNKASGRPTLKLINYIINELNNIRKIPLEQLNELAQYIQEYTQSAQPDVLDFVGKVSNNLGEPNDPTVRKLLIDIELSAFCDQYDFGLEAKRANDHSPLVKKAVTDYKMFLYGLYKDQIINKDDLKELAAETGRFINIQPHDDHTYHAWNFRDAAATILVRKPTKIGTLPRSAEEKFLACVGAIVTALLFSHFVMLIPLVHTAVAEFITNNLAACITQEAFNTGVSAIVGIAVGGVGFWATQKALKSDVRGGELVEKIVNAKRL